MEVKRMRELSYPGRHCVCQGYIGNEIDIIPQAEGDTAAMLDLPRDEQTWGATLC